MGCQISYDGDSVTLETAEEFFVALDILPTTADKEILQQIGSRIVSESSVGLIVSLFCIKVAAFRPTVHEKTA
jgi:hypothetical protein